MRSKLRSFFSLALLLCFQNCETARETKNSLSIDGLIAQVNQSNILASVTNLQNLGTRVEGYPGNYEAATYIFNKLSSNPGLSVTYQGGAHRNVIATLPGSDEASDRVFIVGAHYDTASSTPTLSPGATDNGCGVAIVLELARIMSRYRFKHDLKFAAWNGEEQGSTGSYAYVDEAISLSENIDLYINYDSAGYDPNDRLILDIMYNEFSSSIAEMMEQSNVSYGLGLSITFNIHSCWSDHWPFWDRGFRGITTHSEQHAPAAHTSKDTVDLISTRYAMKNGQLGLTVLAEMAELLSAR